MTSCLHPLCDPEHTNIGLWFGVRDSHPLGSHNLIVLSVVMAEGERPVPSRTRKLSPPAPMVLHSPGCGRVGRRRHSTFQWAPANRRGPTCFFTHRCTRYRQVRVAWAELSTSCLSHPQFRCRSRFPADDGARSKYVARRGIRHERGAGTMSAIYVTVPGRIATRPERLTSKNGTGVRFRIASTERWYNRTAEGWSEAEPVYLGVACWRQLAESVLLSLRVGDPVIVHGKLVNLSFERDGRVESRLEISAAAVGPDLRWSTAVVTRTKAAAADAPPSVGADDEGAVGADGAPPDRDRRG